MIDVTQPASAVNSIKLSGRDEKDIDLLYCNYTIHILNIMFILKSWARMLSLSRIFRYTHHYALKPKQV